MKYFIVKKNTKDLRLLVLEKKRLHAVGDPVQAPEIVPSKKSKIESNTPLTRSKVSFLACGFNCFKFSLNDYLCLIVAALIRNWVFFPNIILLFFAKYFEQIFITMLKTV